MNTKNNQRAKNTRGMIERVFIDLLKQKDLEKITVSEVCKASHINRTTFYAHYLDVFDLMEKIELAMSERMVQIFTSGQLRSISDGFEKLFAFVRDNADFYAAYLGKSGSVTILKVILPESLDASMIALCKEMGYKSEDEYHYQEQFFKAGLTGLIRMWLANDCRETPGELCEIIHRQYNQSRSPFIWTEADASSSFRT